MLNVDNPQIFTDAHSIKLTPVVSAEWNQNLFTPPYVTVAGDGVKKELGTVVGTVTDADVTKPNFTTKQFSVASGAITGSISYPITTGLGGNAYKIVTYIKTNAQYPVLINTTISGDDVHQHGSNSVEVDSFKWTKVETYIGSEDDINTLEYKIKADIIVTYQDPSISNYIPAFKVYYTLPEVYETTLFDYKYSSMWNSDSPFKFFRPGESYVKTGNDNIDFPSNYRRIATKISREETLSSGYYGNKYIPISPVCYNPGFAIMENPYSTIIKNGLPTNIMPYQYFISDIESNILTGIYEKDIYLNKIVIKFNNILTYPSSVTITINDSVLPTTYTPNSRGILTLYWTGSDWSTTEWTSMPIFNDSAVVSKFTTIRKITVQTIETQSSNFNLSTYNGIDSESNRMQIIEISPRLEIDLSNLVQSVNINKSLDSDNSQVPISSLNANDASITLSGIPTFIAPDDTVPIFSNQSNYLKTLLKGMLTRNVKFYINFYAEYGFDADIGDIDYPTYNTYIPGGIFYSDSWTENDIDTIDIQLFDVVRYLQSTSVPDYVANIKPIFDVITDILDLSGFTDYDYDSLYNACNNKSVPMDVAFYYCNSRETTIAAALSEIFLSYQIGAYIDEYGIMKFLSLAESINPNLIDNTLNTNIIDLADKDIVEGGYSISNKEKPGRISIRYQPPQIKQSASVQNITNPDIKNSPSFVLTTSNDVNWTQEQLDTVGFNYLQNSMLKGDSSFKLDVNDLLDIFRTYSLNFSGYAAIEDEIISIKYKEYVLRNQSFEIFTDVGVSVKNDIELSSYINKYSKEYGSKLITSIATTSTSTHTISGGTKNFVLASNTGFVRSGRAKVMKRTTSTYSSGGATGSTSFVISSANTEISAGQKIIGNGFAENTVVRSVSGTTINFYPKALSQISGTISFISQDKYMTGYITNTPTGFMELTIDSFSGIGTYSNWYVENVPNYDILVQPTGDINFIDRGVFNTKVSDHKIIGTSLTDKNMDEVSIEYTAGPPSSISFNTSSSNSSAESGKIVSATPANSKVIIYPASERDIGYQTYSTKFKFIEDPTQFVFGAGLVFNLDSTLTTDQNAYFVEMYQYREYYDKPWKYMMIVYRITTSGDREIIAYSDISYIAQLVLESFPKVHVRNSTAGDDKYAVSSDSYWHLKVVHQSELASQGNVASDGDKTISVYLNNIEISNWEVAGIYSDLPLHTSTTTHTIASTGSKTFSVSGMVSLEVGDEVYLISSTNISNYMLGQVSAVTSSSGTSTITVGVTASNGSGSFSSWNICNKFDSQRVNYITGLRKKLDLPYAVSLGTIFGAVNTTRMPTEILFTTPTPAAEDIFEMRELYATQTPLSSASINYHYQDKNFLNGAILGQRNTEKTYCMQTTPEVVGINYYDVEYDSPAAVSTDIYPVEYNWHYFPGSQVDDQKYRQVLTIQDSAVAYSTVVNTGFRGKFMIANNSPHVVFLNKDSDDLNQFNIRLNVWTHEIIAPSAQENIEKIVDPFNSSETIQIDSEWLQSRDAAEKMASTVAAAIDPFSKNINIEIFGNPLIQIGDIINLDYGIKGISQQKHLVKSVSHNFDSGLSTKLGLSPLDYGVDYE